MKRAAWWVLAVAMAFASNGCLQFSRLGASCTTNAECGDAYECIDLRCATPGDAVDAGELSDAGEPSDAGDAGDAGEPSDAGDAGDVSDAGASDAGDAGEVVDAGAVVVVVGGPSISIASGQCTPLTVELHDMAGALLTGTNTFVTVLAPGAPGSLYEAPDCQFSFTPPSLYNGRVTLGVRASVFGPVVLSLSVQGLPVTPPPSSVVLNFIARAEFLQGGGVVSVGAHQPGSVHARDSQGQPAMAVGDGGGVDTSVTPAGGVTWDCGSAACVHIPDGDSGVAAGFTPTSASTVSVEGPYLLPTSSTVVSFATNVSSCDPVRSDGYDAGAGQCTCHSLAQCPVGQVCGAFECVRRWRAVPQTRGLPWPSARQRSAMAWDGTQLALFGGERPSDGGFVEVPNDTWLWDGWTWALAKPPVVAANAPSPRAGHSMVSLSTGVLALYGGVYDGGALGDGWVWSGQNWDSKGWGPLTWTNAPPAGRYGHAAAAVGTGLVVCGGVSDGGLEPEFLLESGSAGRWSRGAGDAGCASLAYGAAAALGRDTFVVAGGMANTDGGVSANVTLFQLDGGVIVRRVNSTLPAPLYGHVVASDGTTIVIAGGYTNLSGTLSTVVYLGTENAAHTDITWTELDGGVPTPRAFSSMAYDPVRKAVVLFGGVDGDGGVLNDVWELPLP